MVVLSHEIIARPRERAEGQAQAYKSSLVTYGTPHASAMARTVGLPVAIAALHVLDGKVDGRGVMRPDDPNVYRPVLRGLEEMGLVMKENVLGENDSLESRLVKTFR